MAGHDDGDPLHALTPREREVLELLRLGLTNGEIAGRLEITLDGAKYHVSEIISKLGVRDRHEAASYPERRSGWATALAPISFLWRQAGALVSVKASTVALVASAGAGAAALGGIGLIVFFLVQGGGGALGSREILASAARFEGGLLDELGPGTTLHGIEVRYRRHGPIRDRLAAEHGDFYQPESAVAEAWVVFDDAGELASRRTEVRGLDGTVYQESWIEGSEFISRDPLRDSEKRIALSMLRIPGTVSEYRARRVDYTTNWMDEMATAPSTTVEDAMLDGGAVWLIERKEPVTDFVSPLVSSGAGEGRLSYTLPYVADLDLVEKVIRWSIRQSDYFLLKEEVLGIDAAGSEHLLESQERTVLEVTTP